MQEDAHETRFEDFGTVDVQPFEVPLVGEVHEAVAVGDCLARADVYALRGFEVHGRDAADHFARALGGVEGRNFALAPVDEIVRGAAMEGLGGVRLKGVDRFAQGGARPVLPGVLVDDRVQAPTVEGRQVLDVFGTLEAPFDLKA